MFLKELITQIIQQKPDDNVRLACSFLFRCCFLHLCTFLWQQVQFAVHFFRRIKNCHHVLGMDFAYITSCKYNRRAFVFCLTESFQSIPDTEKFTINEFYQMLDLICLDVPRNIISDVMIGPSSSDLKYDFRALKINAFANIIYGEW